MGLVSGIKVSNKLERFGLTTRKSEFVDVPVINEFPLTAECRVLETQKTALGFIRVVSEILNIAANESILDAEGNV